MNEIYNDTMIIRWLCILLCVLSVVEIALEFVIMWILLTGSKL